MSKSAAFSRGGPLCWLVLLASGVALLPALPSPAFAYQFGEPGVRAIGAEERVFDWSTQKCSNEDIPDHPARAFRDSQNRIQLIASHASVRRKIGTSLAGVQHQCPIVLDSHGNQDPAAFDDKEWLSSTYTTDGVTIHGLTSIEYHGWEYDEACAPFVGTGDHLKCWYNSIGLVKSVNGGTSYSHAPAPAHRVANSPYRYAPGNGPLGIFDPSNIIEKDGYYYVMVRAEQHQAQQWGACLMRTQTLGDPGSWRAWDGTGFGVRFMDPYVEQNPPENHVCRPVSPQNLNAPIQTASLTHSSYLGKYVLVGVSQKLIGGVLRSGFYYSLSDDLVNWSQMRILMEADLPWTHQCGEPDPVRDPSLLDPGSASRNFETIGRRPYLYFTRFNIEYFDPDTCWVSLDRDLIRIPIEFTEPNRPPAASFTTAPNPATAGQVVSFNGSASSDPDGSISSYEWDLDGNSTFETDSGPSPTTTMAYPAAATITVRLRVTDTDGATAETSRTLNVNPPPPTNQLPTASFVASPNPALTGATVTFDGSASSDPDGTISSYEWDLDGDGLFEKNTGATAATAASYQSATPVTVRLRVTDNESGADDASVELILNLPPTPTLPPPAIPPGPPGPPAQRIGLGSPSPTGKCASARKKRDRLTKRLRSARRKLARARTAAKRRHYRRLVRKLKAQRRKLRTAGC